MELEEELADVVGHPLAAVGRFLEDFREVLVFGHLAEVGLALEDVADVLLIHLVGRVLELGDTLALEDDRGGFVADVPEHREEFPDGAGFLGHQLDQLPELGVDLFRMIDRDGLGGILEDIQTVIDGHRDGLEVQAVDGAHQAAGDLLLELGQQGIALDSGRGRRPAG